MPDIKSITDALIKFRQERDWQQFHTPKNIAISLALEAAEVLELFQWKNDDEAQTLIQHNPELLADELADVLNWVLLLAHDANIDIMTAAQKKIIKNELKYPVAKAKGNAQKYTEFKR